MYNRLSAIAIAKEINHLKDLNLNLNLKGSASPPMHSPYMNHFCELHGEPHKLYCEKCDRTKCGACNESIGGCRHKLIHIQEACNKAKQANCYFESEIDTIIRDLREGIHRAEINKMHNDKTCQMVQFDIAENYRRLQERVSHIMRDVSNEKKQKDKNLELHRSRLDMILKKMRSASQAIRDSKQSDNPWDILVAKDKAAREIRIFKQREKNVLFIDESDITFIPPEDDLFRHVTVPDIKNLVVLPNRPIYGFGRPIVVKKPEGAFNTFVFGGPGPGHSQLCRPWGVCCNQQGLIYVADRSNDRIQVFNPDGSFHRTFGYHGYGLGELNRPAGIAVSPNGNIVVADKDNHRIQVFTAQGEFVRAFGRKGQYQGQFNYPWDVACNSKGQIIVSDSRNHRIQLFEEDGKFLRMYGYELNSTCFKNFDTPRGVCFTPSDEVIVTDFNNHKLLKLDITFDKSPSYIGCEGTAFKQFRRPQGVVCDDRGNLIIADSRNDRIQVLDSMGNFLWAVGRTGDGKGQLNTPSGICLSPEGRIIVVDYGNHRVEVF
ncbi:hypothetical protein HHI36_000035 [Cryptolaemus montrouzieri]|uniref:Uncharacterized protein n=1 Tax=Cryptolaemus montrouzieri TaxID=559131 RepID=A0ABD2P455_9CUCU